MHLKAERMKQYICISGFKFSGYRHWHADLRPDDTPLEAGLAFTCKMKSSIPFQGRDRLEHQKKEGLKRRIVCFTIDESVEPRIILLALNVFLTRPLTLNVSTILCNEFSKHISDECVGFSPNSRNWKWGFHCVNDGYEVKCFKEPDV